MFKSESHKLMTWQLARLFLLFTNGFALANGIKLSASGLSFAHGMKVKPNDCTPAQISCPLPSAANGLCAAGVACDNPKRCCTPTNTAQCPDIHGYCGYASGVGDPHMTNIKGENFDIMYAGTHSLVRVPGYGKRAGKVLELSGVVTSFSHLKPIPKCNPFYFSKFDIRGTLLGGNVRNMEVWRDSAGVGFSSFMLNDDQSLLNQSLNNHIGLLFTRKFGAVKVSHMMKQYRDLLVLEIQCDSPIVVTVDWWNNKPGQPGLNINVHGLSPKMESIGGFFGDDPHKNISSNPNIEGCPKRNEIRQIGNESKAMIVTNGENSSSASFQHNTTASIEIYPDVGNSDLDT